MFKVNRFVLLIVILSMGSCFLIRTATVEIPAEDATPPIITAAQFIVCDAGGCSTCYCRGE